ncbi:MAG: histidine phosphatase family protein [Alphaproteobacteria bacterium]|nr:histidine phosphatase family protein [Alphaproteobacteria bacterium]
MREDITLYVLRHGACEHNLQGRIAGQNDSPLTPLGREQARANGLVLKELVADPSRLAHFSSSLHRACVTMELMREAAGLDPFRYLADRRLMEIDCGENTWASWPQIEARASKDPMWQRDRWHYVHPRGESLAMLEARVLDFLGSLPGDTVIVTHAGPLRMIRKRLLGLSETAALEFDPPNAGIMRVCGGAECWFGA